MTGAGAASLFSTTVGASGDRLAVELSKTERGKTGRRAGEKRELKSRPCRSMMGLAKAGMGVETVGLHVLLVLGSCRG